MGKSISLDETIDISAARDLVALSRHNAIRYQDEKGDVVHEYRLPGDYVLKDFTKHYFRFLEAGPSEATAYSLKFNFTQMILNLIRAISTNRISCSVLDIGSTIGETYYLLRELLKFENFSMNLEFVGLDMNSNCVSFARDLFVQDPNFQSVVGEASDLSRFPDETFDFVVSNGVHNHVEDQAKAIREALRVSRVAAAFQIMMTASNQPGSFSHTTARETDFAYLAPTAAILYSMVPDNGRYTWYIPTRGTKRGIKWDNGRYFDAKDLNKIQWHNVIIAKTPLFSSVQ